MYEIIKDRCTWEVLRWETKCSQLKLLAGKLGIPLDGIPNNTMQKERISKKISVYLGKNKGG